MEAVGHRRKWSPPRQRATMTDIQHDFRNPRCPHLRTGSSRHRVHSIGPIARWMSDAGAAGQQRRVRGSVADNRGKTGQLMQPAPKSRPIAAARLDLAGRPPGLAAARVPQLCSRSGCRGMRVAPSRARVSPQLKVRLHEHAPTILDDWGSTRLWICNRKAGRVTRRRCQPR
jgi:hypothetical protein